MIKLLDCTLRDGGYINNWTFGQNNIKKIVHYLKQSAVDFVEVGYLSPGEHTSDNTKQAKLEGFDVFLTAPKDNYLAMINVGEVDIDHIPNRAETNIAGIRVCFKKNNLSMAKTACEELAEKGYKVFVQAMVTMSYTDTEFVDLINEMNRIGIYAFYIVDSFGEMAQEDLRHYFHLAENNLREDIALGFHSHNNLQLSYSNCKCFVGMKTVHNLIVDVSVLGMGRGAGNLNTEIFMEYLNSHFGTHYNIIPIIEVIDKVINNIYVNHFWGYSIPFYLSAKNHCHPNYASYLENKKTLTFLEMDKILRIIDAEHRVEYSKEYVSRLYTDYQNRNETHSDIASLRQLLEGKEVLLIAPGPSSKSHKELITKKANSVIAISVNFIPSDIPVDYYFVSNSKRFSDLGEYEKGKMITTGNIAGNHSAYKLPYFLLTNEKETISDNAGMMAVNLMRILNVKKVFLAGFDGYSETPQKDYADETLQLAMKRDNRYLNDLLCAQLKEYAALLKLEFLTPEKEIVIS